MRKTFAWGWGASACWSARCCVRRSYSERPDKKIVCQNFAKKSPQRGIHSSTVSEGAAGVRPAEGPVRFGFRFDRSAEMGQAQHLESRAEAERRKAEEARAWADGPGTG